MPVRCHIDKVPRGRCKPDSKAAYEFSSADTAVETAEAAEAVVTSDYAEGTAAAQLADVFNGGFMVGSFGSNENGTYVNFYHADHTGFCKATCTMNDDRSEKLFSISWDAEDYDHQVFDVLASCEDLAVITPSCLTCPNVNDPRLKSRACSCPVVRTA